MSGFSVLADVTLGADAASLDLSGLDLSGWYLVRLVSILRCTSGAWQRSMLRFNDDAARNYLWTVKNNDGSAADSSNTATYIAGLEAAHGPGPDQGANYWGVNHVELINPGVNDAYKPYKLWGGNMPISTPYALATTGSGFWQNTAPITKISQVGNESVNWQAGSRAVLLGVIPAHSTTSVAGDSLPTVSDNFNRADGSLGANWTIPDPSHSITIVGNAAQGSNAVPSCDAYWSGDAIRATQFSQAEVPASLGGNEWVGVTARATGLAHNYVLIYFNNSGTYVMMLFSGTGSYTQIGTTYTIGASPLAAGSVIRIETEGTTIRGKLNGATVITGTDASNKSGAPGIAVFGSSKLDNWQGGEL